MKARGLVVVFVGGFVVGVAGLPRWGEVAACAALGVAYATYEHVRGGKR